MYRVDERVKHGVCECVSVYKGQRLWFLLPAFGLR